MTKSLNRLIIISILTLFVFAPFVSAKESSPLASDKTGTITSVIWEVFKKTLEIFLGILKVIFSWIAEIWRSYIWPFLEGIWEKIYNFFVKLIEGKKPEVEEEFKRETDELKGALPQASQALWDSFEKAKKWLKF